MRAFLLSLAATIGLALGAYFVLEGLAARDADTVYILPSARLADEGTVEHRAFSGRDAREAVASGRHAGNE